MFKSKGKGLVNQMQIITVFGLLLATNAGATSIGSGCDSDGSFSGACAITEMGLVRKGFDFPDFDSIINESRVRFSEGVGQKHRSFFQDFSRFSGDAETHDQDKSRGKLHDGLSKFENMLDDDTDGLLMGFYGRDIKHADDFRKRWEHRPRRHHGHHHMPPVPVPAAVWLFGSGLLVLAGVIRRRA